MIGADEYWKGKEKMDRQCYLEGIIDFLPSRGRSRTFAQSKYVMRQFPVHFEGEKRKSIFLMPNA